jgi:RNA polymerase primary sigma factor
MTEDEIINQFMADARRVQLLTKDEEQELGKRILEGDKAAERELVEANLRLVMHVVNRTSIPRGMSKADVLQEALVGLMHAAEKFDHRKGFKFSTYAMWWIKQAVTKSMAQARAVRLPQHVLDEAFQVRRAREQLAQHLHRDATLEEVADVLGITVSRVAFIDDCTTDIASLNSTIGDSSELIDCIADTTHEELPSILSPEMIAALSTLTAREREAVLGRCGIEGGPATWGELGERMGIQKTSARSIQQRGIKKLRTALAPPA